MTKPDKSNWVTERHDTMLRKVHNLLRDAGFKTHHLRFSIFETTKDGVKEDLSDWEVRHPDFATLFAPGKVQFVSWTDDDELVVSEVYENPLWSDVVREGERSCRARGAPELDHVFLESVEWDGKLPDREVRCFEMHFGS